MIDDAASTSRPRSVIYLRISSDPEGRRLGVERQEADCRALCEDYGYDVIEVVTDNDVSASTRSQRERPQFERMMSLARAGRIDMIVAFSTSRLTRKPIEWEGIFALHDRYGTRVHLLKRGLLDLTKAVVRRDLRNDASADAYYAEEVSELVRTASEHRAKAGEWHGGQVPYGFVRVGTGKLEHHPERAEVIRDAARRILSGQSLYSVCMSLNNRGIKTAPSALAPDGARWHSRTLKRVLTSPNTVGVREYYGQEFPGSWPGILDRDTWDRLRTILNDDDRATRQSWLPAQKFTLSGLLVCGRKGCGTKLTSNTSKGRRSFICSPVTGGCGKIRINLEAVEEFVVRQVLAVLSVPAVRDALSQPGDRTGDDELRQAIRDDERRLQRLEDDFYDDLLDRPAYMRQRSRITERLDARRARLTELQRATFMVELGDRTLRQVWEGSVNDPGWRRTLLQFVIDDVTIYSHPEGVPSTITARRNESAEELAERRRELSDRIMLRRVLINWKAERVPDGVPDIDMAAFEHMSHPEKVALWLSRMHANLPVQLADPSVVSDAAALMQKARRPVDER